MLDVVLYRQKSERYKPVNEEKDIKSTSPSCEHTKTERKEETASRYNWSAVAATVCLLAGFIIGFIVPIVGFVFYIAGGLLGLIFSLISLGTFRKANIPGQTIGALICSIVLTFWGLFHLIMFPMALAYVLSFIS